MSAKLLYTLSDENPDLQKRIGCMNGILQLFDRQYFLSGRRVSHKRLPPPGQGGHDRLETSSAFQNAKVQNPKIGAKETQRISCESSRTSISSSSRSSTFSSLEYNKTSTPESSSVSHIIIPVTPIRNQSLNQSSASPNFGRHDIRDVVKDSINREVSVMSVKTSSKEVVGHKMKHIDSPRPLQASKPAKPKVSSPHESFRGLGKLREDPCGYKGGMNGRRLFPPKDAPRFSYDGRESRDKSKSAIKLKELPRLSLDSRTASMRGSTYELKLNYLKGTLLKNGNSRVDESLDQEPGSNKRPPSIVAKLMGLEILPDSMSTNEGNVMLTEFRPDGNLLKSSQRSCVPGYMENTLKDHVSARSRTANSVMKTTSTLRIPTELAPWTQADASPGSPKNTFNCGAVDKAPNSVPSVYGEIEKRLAELEFKKSSKDLRALKQILGAMQKTKEILETKNDDHASDSLSQASNSSNQSSHRQNSEGEHRNLHVPKTIGSPILIVKSAKDIKTLNNQAPSANQIEGSSGLHKIRTCTLVNSRKDIIDKETARDRAPKNNLPREASSPSHRLTDKSTNSRTLRSQKPKTPPHLAIENSTSSGRKQVRLEKQPRSPTPLSDSSKVRRQSIRQQIETGSPGRKIQPKSSLQKFGDHSSLQPDCLQSDSNSCLSSQIDIKVASSSHSDETIGNFWRSGQKHDNPETRPTKQRSVVELSVATPEQPSPVSVLDAMFYGEESPSPVKKTSNAFQDDDTQYPDEPRWSEADLTYIIDNKRSILSFEIDHKKLENVEALVQQLRKLSYPRKDSFIPPLFDSRNQDHRYIYKILSMSGLLQDIFSGLITVQPYASMHVIDPKLFLILEQTEAQTKLSTDIQSSKIILKTMAREQIQRKLIFDAVNEILVRKFALTSSTEACLLTKTQEDRKKSGQQILKELCLEIDQLQSNHTDCRSVYADDDSITKILWEDLKKQPQNWTDSHDEISGLVLDVERLIFKDLINEIVIGGLASPRTRRSGHCRKLF